MLNLSLTQKFWKIFSTTWLWKISIWPLYYHIFWQQGNIEALIQCDNAINMRISLDEHGSKIWKVSRCRPTVSNETILTTKQEFFFTKVAPVQSLTDIVLLGLWLMMHSGMFIFSYNTFFFVNNIFFSNVYISANTIFDIRCS